MTAQRKYWFLAKRYGWGWGLPSSWQGWAVLICYIALLSLGAIVLSPSEHPIGYSAFGFSLTLLFLAICYLKGEPPRWRWGK